MRKKNFKKTQLRLAATEKANRRAATECLRASKPFGVEAFKCFGLLQPGIARQQRKPQG